MPRSSAGPLQLLFAKLHLVVIYALFSAVAGCSPGEPKIGIETPTAELSPVFLGVASVFLTIRNDGGRDALVGASVNIPDALVELHDVKDRRMLKVERIAIPSRGSVALKPGGQHLMIYNMPRTLHAGAEIDLTLRFERSGERRVPVRIAMPAGS
jgi:hypothetical protein